MLTKEELTKKFTPVFKRNNVKRAVLFGSYSQGNATKNSDIDIFVKSDLKGLRFLGLLEELREAAEDREIDLIEESHIEKNSTIEREIMSTGIEIYAR